MWVWKAEREEPAQCSLWYVINSHKIIMISMYIDIIIILCEYMGFPGGSAGKESACNAEDLGSIPGSGRSPGEGEGYPLQYSDLENSINCIDHGVAKGRTRLSNFYFIYIYIYMESGKMVQRNLFAGQE